MSMSLMPILYAWGFTLLLQFISWPLVYLAVKDRLVDKGWAIARIATWLSVGLIIWFLAHFKLPANHVYVIWALLIAGLIGSLYIIYTRQQGILSALGHIKVFVFTQEFLFALGLFGLSIIRSFNPAILDLEKPMDAGFMASYIRSTTLPAADMWLAGGTINYYSFGHYLGSVMSRIWLLPISISYNILLGLIMGLTFMLSFSLIINLINPTLKKNSSKLPLFVGGIIGSLLVTVGGNTHTIWFWLKNITWQGYWYADATRFIERTIHEFPSYSFVVSDLHAHVWSLPLVLTFLILVILWTRTILESAGSTHNRFITQLKAMLKIKTDSGYFRWVALTLGVFIGVFVMTSAWDAMIYTLLLGIVGFIILFAKPKLFPQLLLSAIIVVVTAALVALPWLINFESISEGAAIATEHSPIWQLFALWTGHVVMSLLALTVAATSLYKLHKARQLNNVPVYHYYLVIGFTILAWLLLLLPEVIYIKDIYSGHPRANTMFKLTYQAFILMSLLGGWVIGIAAIKNHLSRLARAGIILIIFTITVFVLLFPYFSYRDYYGRFNNFKGLNGYRWLYERYPDDYAAIMWMADNIKGQPVIVEAVGESYTDFNQVSAITGIPTVLGWRVHEWLWRGGFDIPGQRTTEVETIYHRPTSVEAQNLLNQYQVKYIFVGTKERENYKQIDEPGLKSLGTTVFQQGNVYIIQRNPQTYSPAK